MSLRKGALVIQGMEVNPNYYVQCQLTEEFFSHLPFAQRVFEASVGDSTSIASPPDHQRTFQN